MKCNHCGEDIAPHPEEAVEEGEISEVVGHKQDAEEPWKSEKSYYCSPDCFIENFTGEEQ